MCLRAACALVLLVVSAGCASSEQQAHQRLEADGLTDIKLNARENGFEFTAKDRGGNACKGSITGSSSFGGTPHKVVSSCEPPATPGL